MTRRRVVVTGLGAVCPIGNTVDEAWSNALAGRSGITRITRFDAARLSSQIAGEVKGFDVSPYMSPKEARRMDLFIHYGMAAGLQAWRDAKLQVTPENAGEFAGLDRYEARRVVRERLQELGLVDDIERPYMHPVGQSFSGPPGGQWGRPRGAPLYPVARMRLSRTIRAPTDRRGQVARVATRWAISMK